MTDMKPCCKFLTLFAGGLLCGSLLSACPQAENSTTADKQTEASRPPVRQHGAQLKTQRLVRTLESEQGGYRVTYTPTPDPIPLNGFFRLKIDVQSLKGQPAATDLRIQASMPEHNHGMNVQPKVVALNPGQFEVRGLLFHMPGYWELEVTIPPEGQGTPEKAIFGLELQHKPVQTP